MSGESPASVLYSSDATELAVASGSAIPASTRAILISGNNTGGNATYVPSSLHGALGSAEMANDFSVQSNATVTTSGSTLVVTNYFGTQEIALIVNSTVTPTGTTPTLTYTIQEVDPGDATTVYGSSASTTTITTGNSPGVFTAVLNVTTSSMVKVSWTITGTTPSFTGVYATVVSKTTPSTQTINGTVTATNNSVGTDGAAALGFDTQVGGKVTTAAPAYSNGNLDALSLTTVGGLRIDGAYPTGTATASAPDMMEVGGIVTTAAPTYTTGQINALSLTTGGLLRVDASGTTVQVTSNKAATSSVTSVASSASNVQLLAANANRLFAAIYNESTKKVFIKLGTTASATSYTIQLLPNSYWEVPVDYTGEIDAIWAAAQGSARVTELSP